MIDLVDEDARLKLRPKPGRAVERFIAIFAYCVSAAGIGLLLAIGMAALATNATDGFLYVPTCAGVPTGTPTAKTGSVPMVVDTTNNRLYLTPARNYRAEEESETTAWPHGRSPHG